MKPRRLLQGSMLAVWVLCLPVGAAAQQPVPVHLAELETRAQAARPRQRANDARLQNARARIAGARAAYSPTLNLITDASMSPGQRIVTIGEYKVTASFPIG